MRLRSRFLANARPIVILCCGMCAVGALASVFIILVRIPALSTTKLEDLVGTLQGVAVALLFCILAIMINLTYMVHRASTPAAGDKQPVA